MPGLLALDTASTAGWAFWEPGMEAPVSGVQVYIGKRPQRLLAYVRWLTATLRERNPDRIVYEEPYLPPARGPKAKQNAKTAKMLYGFEAMTEAFVLNHDRIAYGVTPSQWRRHFIGSAGAKRKAAKSEALEACRIRGWPAADDNEADALGILDYGCALYEMDVPWPKTAIEAIIQAKQKGIF